MLLDVDAVVGPDGWVTYDRLIARVSPNTVRAWLRTRWLIRVDTGVYATAQSASGD